MRTEEQNAQHEKILSMVDEFMTRPTIAQSMPPEIEAKAIERYENETQAVTGNKWDWNKENEPTQNVYRLRAWIAATPSENPGCGGRESDPATPSS